MKILLKSKPFPVILMVMSLVAIVLFNSYDINWVFINNTIGVSWFTNLLLILMVLTLFSGAILSALRIYKENCRDKKAYTVLISITGVLAFILFLYTLISSIGFLVSESKFAFLYSLKDVLSNSALLILLPLTVIFYPALSKKCKKAVGALVIVAAVLIGLNAYYPLTPYKITSTPMVIDTGSEYSVVFSTNDKGSAYIEYTFEGKDYKVFDGTGGRLNTESKIHSIPVPYEHLKNNTYSVSSTRVIDEYSYGSRLGKTVTSENFSFKVNEGDNQNWLLISDWHTLLKKAYKAIGNVGEYDGVVLLGDATPGVDFEEEIIRNIVKFGGEVSKGSMPVLYVRGNHETRGAYANDLASYLGIDEFYTTTDIGPYSFIILDSGEDKDDSHSEYGGMTDYNSYRASMLQWLKTVEVKNDKVIALSHSWKISDVERDISLAAWDEIDRLGARMMLSGHNHECRFLGDGSEYEKEVFALHPDIIGFLDGGKCGDEEFIASKLTLNEKGFNIKAVSYKGDVIFDENFLW